jgi:hypothetical protein
MRQQASPPVLFESIAFESIAMEQGGPGPEAVANPRIDQE